ncbi:MAG: hypothetical protein CVV63_04870 [Tenericutes bacterium HGW-Tenericutes-8]|nr:MAG: hypothetical protein CVV63_04870 [Tenericutes bacterium HGW-Tenericutes-8]
MGNILLISERPKPFGDLVHLLEKSNYRVILRKYDVFLQKKQSDMIFDFVLYDLLPCHEENLRHISLLYKHGSIPIYVFGTEYSELDEVAFYDAGANGVVRMPLQTLAVAARIKSVINLLEKTSRVINKVKIGPLEIDLHNRVVKKEDKVLKLTNVESKILHILIQNKNTVVDKDAIIHFAWDDEDSATDNALGIHIARLRSKVEFDQKHQIIDTIWGIGYRLNYHTDY